jgi:hypothetical protein
MGAFLKFVAGGVTAVAIIGTVVMVKLISEAGKTLRQEMGSYKDPDA